MKKSVQVTILGQQYTVRSDLDPVAVRKVADFANRRISEVARQDRVVDTLNTVVLALLNLSGEYLALKEQAGGGEGDEMQMCLDGLVQRLEGELSRS